MNTCKTNYPILLVHGMGARDRKWLNYWGRIPKILKTNGARIFYAHQDSNATIESNAQLVANAIDLVLDETGMDKVNIIAHSKGGLEARYVISSLGYSKKVASLTTISTPHNGSFTVDKLLRLPKVPIKLGCKLVDIWMKILGDKRPDTYATIHQFRTDFAKQFNQENLDQEDVYYQSYGFVMKGFSSDFILSFPHLIVRLFEGENDGLLTPQSVAWTNFRGVMKGTGRRGISHCDEVDMRRRPLNIKYEDQICDITDFYVNIVGELTAKGF